MAVRLPSQPLSGAPVRQDVSRGVPRYVSVLSGLHTAFIYLRTMAAFVLVWYLASLWIANPTLMPAPLTVARNFMLLAADGELLENALVSLRRLGISFFAAGAIGIPIGLLMGMSRIANELIDPVVEMLRPISGIAWVPLGMFLLGVGDTLPMAIMFYGALFPFIINTLAGVRAVDPRLIQVAQTLGVPTLAIWRHIIWPGALPNVLVGARLAAGAAWMSMVAAELIGAPSGLGFAIEWYRELLATPKVFAVIFVVGLLGYLVDRGLRALHRALTPWLPEAELAQ